jgi:CheY-like chemotaxis protein
VLDVLLPELDGLAACRELRRRGTRTPILILTAGDAVEHRVAGLDAGADDYLVIWVSTRLYILHPTTVCGRIGTEKDPGACKQRRSNRC